MSTAVVRLVCDHGRSKPRIKDEEAVAVKIAPGIEQTAPEAYIHLLVAHDGEHGYSGFKGPF